MWSNEHLEFAGDILDMLRRRWLYVLAPLLICIPIVIVALKMSPKTYTAASTILLRPAQQQDQARSNPIEQLVAIEAWLKSDQVLNAVLPAIIGAPKPDDPEKLYFALERARIALSLKLEGNALLVIELSSDKAEGLGRRLETVVSHLLEGLLRPDSGLLTASQLILLNSDDVAREAEQQLRKAIEAAGLGDPTAVVSQLSKIVRTERELGVANPNGQNVFLPSAAALELKQLRSALTSNPAVLKSLVIAYDGAERARSTAEATRQLSTAREVIIPSIFDAPHRLTVIGRPRDPLFGKNSARKYAALLVLASLAIGVGLAILAELIDTRLRYRQQIENLTSLPVLARVSVSRR